MAAMIVLAASLGFLAGLLSFRAKSPERVLAELSELAQSYGRLDFFFVDYILNRAYFDDLLPRLRDAGYDLRIFCETKANLRREEVRLLHDAGFTAIQAGVESMSTPVLKLMRKGVTALQNLRLLKWCAEYDVRLYWNVLYGIPGEPTEAYEVMAELVPSRAHLEQHPAVRFLAGIVDAMLQGWDHAKTLAALRLAPRFAESRAMDRFDFAVREQIPKTGLGELRSLTDDEPLLHKLDSLAPLEEWQGTQLGPEMGRAGYIPPGSGIEVVAEEGGE